MISNNSHNYNVTANVTANVIRPLHLTPFDLQSQLLLAQSDDNPGDHFSPKGEGGSGKGGRGSGKGEEGSGKGDGGHQKGDVEKGTCNCVHRGDCNKGGRVRGQG